MGWEGEYKNKEWLCDLRGFLRELGENLERQLNQRKSSSLCSGFSLLDSDRSWDKHPFLLIESLTSAFPANLHGPAAISHTGER